MKNFKEPYYLLDFSSSICNFEVNINEMPAFSNSEGGSISSHTPINHFILESGIQNIKINVTPLKGESNLRDDAFIKLKIFCYDSSTTNYEDTLNVFNYEKLDFSENKLPVINFGDKFKAEVNYVIEGWRNSRQLKNAIKDERILLYFKSIHSAFKNQNVNFLFQEMEQKFKEIDISMYLGIVDNKKELSQLFLSLDKFKLQDFPTEFKIKLYGNDKVCTLLNKDDLPAIHYVNIATDEEFSFPIFITIRDENYQIIR